MVTPSNVTVDGVNWSSADTSVATVSGGTVTGKAAGTSTVTATSKSDKSIVGTATITVTTPVTGE